VDQIISSSGSTIWTSGVALVSEPQATIVRIRGLVTFTLQAASGIGDGFQGALGFGVMTTAAFTAGVASIPTPVTEAEWDGWMFHQFFDVRAVTATIADGSNAVGNVFRMPIDTKAMRIIGDSQTLVPVIEVVESGTASMEMQGETRLLLKLV